NLQFIAFDDDADFLGCFGWPIGSIHFECHCFPLALQTFLILCSSIIVCKREWSNQTTYCQSSRESFSHEAPYSDQSPIEPIQARDCAGFYIGPGSVGKPIPRRYSSSNSRASILGALLRHAATSARRSVSFFTARSRTLVQPRAPHAPAHG